MPPEDEIIKGGYDPHIIEGEDEFSLTDIFAEADFGFRDQAPSELDDLAYRFILRFLENTNPLSPFGLFVYKRIQPERNWSGYTYDNSVLPILGKVFPPHAVSTRNAISKLDSEIKDIESKKRELTRQRMRDKRLIKAREPKIAKLEKDKQNLKEGTNTDALDVTLVQYTEEVDSAKARVISATPNIDRYDEQIRGKRQEIKRLEKSAQDRGVDLQLTEEILKSPDKKYVDLREQIATDWQFAINWIREKIDGLKSQQQEGALQDNLGILRSGLSLSHEDFSILQHIVLVDRVDFYKKFLSRVGILGSDETIIRAKLCAVHPDKFKQLALKNSPLIDKGLVSAGLKLDGGVLSVLATPGLSQTDVMTKLAGMRAKSHEQQGFGWREVSQTQGSGTDELEKQLKLRRKDPSSPPITAFIYGEKGSAKTQGMIKLAHECGYDNAILAPEFDEDGRPLSYTDRLSYIRRALAIGENIDGFLLIIDEMDKMGGDKGASSSLELLRLCENPSKPIIAIANDDVFSEAFKDRFTFSVEFHVPVSDRRIETFFQMAAGKLPDLDTRKADYERLLANTSVASRPMAQAVELGRVGGGYDSVVAAFEAKALLMTKRRNGLHNTEPVIEPWRYNYFNGVVRERPDTSHEDLLTHLKSLEHDKRGVSILLGGVTPGVEIEALVPEMARALGMDLLWTDLSSFNNVAQIEKTLNKARDLGLMLAVKGADSVPVFDSDEVLGLLTGHSLPTVFLCNESENLVSSSQFCRAASFIVDCRPPTSDQRKSMVKQFLSIDLSTVEADKMPDLTLDTVQLVALKKDRVLNDPADEGAIRNLLKYEYQQRQNTMDQVSLFVGSFGEYEADPVNLNGLGKPGQKERGRVRDLTFLGPVRKI